MTQSVKIKKGFTLIELLVVISIIGILATLLMANLTSMRGRARDAQRKSDMRNIQTALRLYYNDFNYYPDGTGLIKGCGDGSEDCRWGLDSFEVDTKDAYMNLLPNDPSPDRTYYYVQNDDDDYDLSACIENKSDTKCSATDCTDDYCLDPNCASAPSGCIYTVKP